MYLANDFLGSVQQLFDVDSQLYSILIVCVLGTCILLAPGTCLYLYFLKRRQTGENYKGQLRQTASADEESSNIANQYSDTFSLHENPLKSQLNSPSRIPSSNITLQVYSNKTNSIRLHSGVEIDQSSCETSSKCLLGISPINSRNPSPTNSRNLSPAHSYYTASSTTVEGDRNTTMILSLLPFLKNTSFQERSSKMESVDIRETLEEKRMKAVRIFNPLSLNRLDHTGKIPTGLRSPHFSSRKLTLFDSNSYDHESLHPIINSSTNGIHHTKLTPTLPTTANRNNLPSLETISEVDADTMITTRSSTVSTTHEADGKLKLAGRESNSVVVEKLPLSIDTSTNNSLPTFIQTSSMLQRNSSTRNQLALLQNQLKEDDENMSKRGKAGRIFLQDNPLMKSNTSSRSSTVSAASGSPIEVPSSPASHSINFHQSDTTPISWPNANMSKESICFNTTTSKPFLNNVPTPPPPPPPPPPTPSSSIASVGSGNSDKNGSAKSTTRLRDLVATGKSVKEMAARAFLIMPIHALKQQQQQSSQAGVESILESLGPEIV